MYAIIRVRGTANVRKEVEDTLKMMRLNRKMHCVVLKDTDNVKGMLQKAKDWITWGDVDENLLKQLIAKRGRRLGDKRLASEEVDNILNKLKESGKLEGIKPIFRLTPPSKGFKHSIKQQYPKGELGYRGEKINELLKRMI